MPQTKRTVKSVLAGLLGLVGLSAVAGVLATAAVTPAIAVAGVAGSQALTIFDNLPNALNPGAPMEPTIFYGTGVDGEPFELAKFYDQNRTPVKFTEISPLLYDAILSSEDKNFYSHGGVNLAATVKAAFDNARGASSRGASTISQQFVKNVLIQECEWDVKLYDDDGKMNENYDAALQDCFLEATEAKGADGIERKLQEMRYAIQIEKDFSKNDILLGYLNVANFGGQTYGVEAAAHRYFGTTAKNLTLTQAATLAGIVQNPNRYRIDRDTGTNSKEDGFAATKDRRDYVLKRMHANGQITDEQYAQALEAPIEPSIKPTTQGCAAAVDQGYFCQYVRSVIETDETFGKTKNDRQDMLRRGGLKVYTSLDMRIQQPGVEAMHKYAPALVEGTDAAVAGSIYAASGVTIEAATGRILAIVQNTKFNDTPNAKPGETSQVFAADRAHYGAAGFGPGSTYKLFTLLDWLEKGHSVNESLNGKWRGKNGVWKTTICGEDSPTATDSGNYKKNRGYTATPMRFTAQSLNTGFYAMAEKLDLCDINKMAKRLGVHWGNNRDVTTYGRYTDPVTKKSEVGDTDPAKGITTDANTLFTTVLGAKSIAPLQMASAFATVTNKGIFCEPRVIDKVISTDGEELPVPPTKCTQVIAPEVAATAAYALKGVMGATGSAARLGDGVPMIGKTGTNELYGTAMATATTKTSTFIFSGFDSNLSGDWIPRDKRMSLERTYHNGMQLSQIRFPISRAMQGAANAAYGGDRFPQPDRNLTRQVLRDLPSVVGMTVDKATDVLEDAGFSVRVGNAVDSTIGKGLVAEQDPGAGKVRGGTTVTISPSTGKDPNREDEKQKSGVPKVTGMKFTDAKKKLNDAGFRVRDEGCRGNEKVTKQDPGPGPARENSVVTLSCGG